jgi:transcriptional regulator with XRE-family HTH domain
MTRAALRMFLRTLEERRQNLKMSLDSLAARSGLSRATVCRILSARHISVTILNVAALAEALGVSVKLRSTEQGVNLEFTPTAIECFVDKQAHYQAKRLVGMVQGTMSLEAQALDPISASELVNTTRHRLVNSSWKKLWVE